LALPGAWALRLQDRHLLAAFGKHRIGPEADITDTDHDRTARPKQRRAHLVSVGAGSQGMDADQVVERVVQICVAHEQQPPQSATT
jgi:hypothetical protein